MHEAQDDFISTTDGKLPNSHCKQHPNEQQRKNKQKFSDSLPLFLCDLHRFQCKYMFGWQPTASHLWWQAHTVLAGLKCLDWPLCVFCKIWSHLKWVKELLDGEDQEDGGGWTCDLWGLEWSKWPLEHHHTGKRIDNCFYHLNNMASLLVHLFCNELLGVHHPLSNRNIYLLKVLANIFRLGRVALIRSLVDFLMALLCVRWTAITPKFWTGDQKPTRWEFHSIYYHEKQWQASCNLGRIC